MCIVCEIKEGLCKADGSVIAEVMPKVEELARGLDVALGVAQEVANAHPQAFSNEQRTRLQSAANLLNDRKGSIGGLAAILAAILGGEYSVEVSHIELRDGESPEDAVERYMAEKKAERSTKH